MAGSGGAGPMVAGGAGGTGTAGGASSSGTTGGAGASGGAGGTGGTGGAGGAPSACAFEPFTGRAPDACHASDGEHNYLADAENCCVPGRSCLGGACVEGKCTPVTLTTATEGHQARGVAVDGDSARVLWASATRSIVFATENTADGATEPLAELGSAARMSMLTRLEDSLFLNDWASSSLRRMPLQGNITVATVATAEGSGRHWQPVVGDGWVYWITGVPQRPEQDPEAPDTPRRIWAARADKADQQGLPVLDGDMYVGGLAKDATHLYWTAMPLDGAQASVQRMALGEPSEPETVASIGIDPDERPGDIEVGERIYWIAGPNIYAVDKDGSGPGVLAAADYPRRLVADSTFVYWYTPGARQIRRVRTSGGATETLADSTFIGGLAQDCRALYWTTVGSAESASTVHRLAK
ncbi:hypothetical protein [Sorangium sp. So ce1335]|uniref:hypothetical protein n=1 Tax=Sorangium sp. So ce1335 TaxID=3133335 RepID=UPI003F63B6A9